MFNQLDNSRHLLCEAYNLFLKKQELISETLAVIEQMEAKCNAAYEQLPDDHDPNNWVLIDFDMIAKWPDCDTTHVVEFNSIH